MGLGNWGLECLGWGLLVLIEWSQNFLWAETSKQSEETSHRDVQGKSIPHRGNDKSKGPGEVPDMFAEQHGALYSQWGREWWQWATREARGPINWEWMNLNSVLYSEWHRKPLGLWAKGCHDPIKVLKESLWLMCGEETITRMEARRAVLGPKQ